MGPAFSFWWIIHSVECVYDLGLRLIGTFHHFRIWRRLQQLRVWIQPERGGQAAASLLQGGSLAHHHGLRLLPHHPDLRQRHLRLHVLQLLLERTWTASTGSGAQEHPDDHVNAGGNGETGSFWSKLVLNQPVLCWLLRLIHTSCVFCMQLRQTVEKFELFQIFHTKQPKQHKCRCYIIFLISKASNDFYPI